MNTNEAPAARTRKGWSLQRRLAMRLVLAVGSVLLILFIVLDVLIDEEIFDHFDRSLGVRAANIAAALDRPDGAAALPLYDRNGHTEFFTLYRADGSVWDTSPNSAGFALPRGPNQHTPPRYYDAHLPDGHAGRLLATPIELPGEAAPGLLVVGTEREQWDATESRVHHMLAFGIALALVLVMTLCLWLVRESFAHLLRHGQRIERLDADAAMPAPDELPRELAPFVAAVDTGVRRLKDAIQRERRFSRDVAHELRTPIAEIRIVAEAAENADSAPELQAALATVVASSERMQRSIDTLLLLARIESGQEIPAPDPVDLAVVIGHLLDAMRPLAAERHIAFDTDLPTSAWMRGDTGMLERIAANLLANAIEYAPTGTTVRCRITHAAAGFTLTIDNDAPNLDDDDVRRFGQRFWRGSSEGGTARHAGLGLALTVTIAQAAGWPLAFTRRQSRLEARLGPLPKL